MQDLQYLVIAVLLAAGIQVRGKVNIESLQCSHNQLIGGDWTPGTHPSLQKNR